MGDFNRTSRGGGGFRGRSPGRGFSRGGDRGRGGFGGGFRGSRGGDRGGFGGRGGFRGRGDGGFRGSSGFRGRFDGEARGRGAFRGRGGAKSGADRLKEAPTPFFEIRDGLSLTAEFKDKISTDDLKATYKDLHMVSAAKTQGKSYLLFKTVRGVEKAHKKLSSDENCASVEFCGNKSPRYNDEVNKIVVTFPEKVDISKVKGLHDGIISVSLLPGRDNSYYVEFETPEAAMKAETAIESKRFSLGVDAVRYSQGLRNFVVARMNLVPTCVCLRDVPKSATLQELASEAPNAIGIRMYKNTFPASDYCHASIEFMTAEEASSFLSEHSGSLKIAGTKVYVQPGIKSLLADDPLLGESKGALNQKRKKDKKEKEESEEKPAKKQKLDAEATEEEEAPADGEDGEEDESEEEAEDEEGDSDEEAEDEEGDSDEEDEGEDNAEGEDEEDEEEASEDE